MSTLIKTKHLTFIILLSILYISYWIAVSPIQYNGDSETYLGLAHMFLGKPPVGPPALFRSPAYPILLILTGTVIPGTFYLLILTQSIFALCISILIYKLMQTYSQNIAVWMASICLLSGTYIIHVQQIMSEELCTFLLFTGLYLNIRILKTLPNPRKYFVLFALIDAALNATKPFAWLIFWSSLAITSIHFYKTQMLQLQKRHIIICALTFSSLMVIWSIIQDITYSFGGYFSPLVTIKTQHDSLKTIYLNHIPFNEALFKSWKQHIKHPGELSNPFKNKPALSHLATIIKPYLPENANLTKIFQYPNYKNTNQIHQILKNHFSDHARFQIMSAVSQEAKTDWPQRWLNILKKYPFFPITGPYQYRGENSFLVAYSSLQHYQSPQKNTSMISPKHGKSSTQLFAFLKIAKQQIPSYWFNNHPRWKQQNLPQALLYNPNTQYAWDMTFLLWHLMGYYNTSDLLQHVSIETFTTYPKLLMRRIWDNVINVALSPGSVEIDTLIPHLGKIEIYDFLLTQQLSSAERTELYRSQKKYQAPFVQKQWLIQWCYRLFYLSKPIFFILSLAGIIVLWLLKKPTIIPIILLLPHLISIMIYGTLFTALERYTDPTILLPFLVTCITFRAIYLYTIHKDDNLI